MGVGGDSAVQSHSMGGVRGRAEGHTGTHTHTHTGTHAGTYTRMLHIRMSSFNYHYRYRLGVCSHTFISIDSQ